MPWIYDRATGWGQRMGLPFIHALPGSQVSKSVCSLARCESRNKMHSGLTSQSSKRSALRRSPVNFNVSHHGSQIGEEGNGNTCHAQRQEVQQAGEEVSRVLEDIHLQGVFRMRCTTPRVMCSNDVIVKLCLHASIDFALSASR